MIPSPLLSTLCYTSSNNYFYVPSPTKFSKLSISPHEKTLLGDYERRFQNNVSMQQQNALHVATQRADFVACQFFLQYSSLNDLQKQDTSYRAPLEVAIHTQNTSIAEIIFAAAPNLAYHMKSKNRMFYTVVDAMLKNMQSLFHQLLKTPIPLGSEWGQTLLFFAKKEGCHWAIPTLLNKFGTIYFTPTTLSKDFLNEVTAQIGGDSVCKSIPLPETGSLEKKLYTILAALWSQFNSKNKNTFTKSLSKNIERIECTLLNAICPISAVGLQEKINRLSHSINEAPVIIITGSLTHSVVLVCTNKYIYICNKGKTCDKREEALYHVLTVQYNPINCPLQSLKKIRNPQHANSPESLSYIYNEFIDEIGGTIDLEYTKKIEKNCPTSPQKSGNCVVTSAKLAALAIMLAAIPEDQQESDQLMQEANIIRKQFSKWSKSVIRTLYYQMRDKLI